MKKIILAVIIAFAVTAVANVPNANAADKKMAASGGLGITLPMGDIGDAVDFPMIPLLLSFQYAVMPFLTVEADVYYYLYTSPAEDFIKDYSLYQFGASARYWLTMDWQQGSTYEGIYVGGGLARTNVEVEMEFSMGPFGTYSATGSDTFSTLVLKGGYIYPLESILLDLGARYDAIDFEFGDALFTVYCKASYLF